MVGYKRIFFYEIHVSALSFLAYSSEKFKIGYFEELHIKAFLRLKLCKSFHFSVVLGITLATMGEKGLPLLNFFTCMSETMMKITTW
jgi:Na+/H+-dicarboxylate symporter